LVTPQSYLIKINAFRAVFCRLKKEQCEQFIVLIVQGRFVVFVLDVGMLS